jgi:hypothetical protein
VQQPAGNFASSGRVEMTSVKVVEIPEQAAFRVSEAARYLGISPNTLRKRSDLGLIPARRDENGERIFLLRDLDAYLESLPEYDKRGKPVAVLTNWNRTLNGKGNQN